MQPDCNQVFIALLRGVNVGGRNRLPMAKLRAICAGLGCNAAQTYIQSGNLVFASSSSAEALETKLEQAIEEETGLIIPVVVRSASSWRRYVRDNPFPVQAQNEGQWVLLCLSKMSPKVGAAAALQQRATAGESVAKKGDAIWVHYASGVGRSKLNSAILDRCIGSPVTARNWRTVLKLDEMVRQAAAK